MAALILATLPAAGVAGPALAADNASITGKVTVPTGVDATKIRVDAYRTDAGTGHATTNASASGTYTLGGLPAGQYVVRFEHADAPNTSPIIGTYYPGVPAKDAAHLSVPAGGTISGIDQTLEAGGSISGTISVPDGSSQFRGYVQLFTGPNFTEPAMAGTWGAADFVGDTDASGNFSISGLAAGTYKVHYSSYADEWANMWHGKVATASSSPALVLAKAGRIDGLADQVVGGANITGSVTGGGGSNVNVVAADGSVVSTAGTYNDVTTYTAKHVFPGSYTVQFNRSSGYQTDREAQFYKDLSESAGLGSANRVTVTSGQSQTNVNASTRAGGTLTGKIVGTDGSPLGNVPVRVYTKDGSLVTRGTSTEGDGTFMVTGLTTGSYLVAANMLNSRPTAALGQIFSGNVRTESAASPVATTVGQNVDIGTLSFATAGGSAPTFSDVPPGTQFYNEISWLAQKGISTGWTEPNGTTTYRPLQPVNRDAMAAFMYRLAGKPVFTAPAVSPFSDVPVGAQFYKEITWLAAQGISTGWTEADGSKTYRPLQPVNRDAMAAFMYRFAGKPAFTEPSASPFTDVPAGAQFYKEITWLAAQGISTGWTEADGSKTFRPLQSVNRDAMAAFMYRYNTKFGSI